MTDSLTASETAKKYLRLHLCKDIGPIRFANLIRELGDIDRVLGAPVRHLSGVDKISSNLAEQLARQRDEIDVEDELRVAAEHGVRVLCPVDIEYPALLRTVEDPPPCLYVRGHLQPEDAVSLAIVGARQCSRYGAEQAERFAALGARVGLTIVSGMARGIDTCAHRGALAASGRTIAVLGCGLCHLYPPESAELAQQISQNGCVVSELPMRIAPDAKNFPQRNRVIAGLTLGVLVVEAARRSGALISARHATEYNREVFALPGRVDMPSAEGCNGLIRAGAAKLVMRIEDILEELGDTGRTLMSEDAPASVSASTSAPASDHDDAPLFATAETSATTTPVPTVARKLTDIEARIMTALAEVSTSVEELCSTTGLPVAQIAAALTGLQIKGLVRRLHGDFYEPALKA